MKIIEISEHPFYELNYRSSGRGGQVSNVTLPFYKAKVDTLPDDISSFVITSDLQGREEDKVANRLVGEAVAEELKFLSELGETPEISLVILAGDLYDHPELHKLGGTGNVTAVWNAFAREFPLVVGVHGNHDIVDEHELAANTMILDGSNINCLGLSIGGVSGIIGREDRNQRKSKSEFMRALTAVTKADNKLVLLHQGPEDKLNQQLGDSDIADHLILKGSGLVAFGHCHWDKPLIELGKNQALNVDNRLYVISTADI